MRKNINILLVVMLLLGFSSCLKVDETYYDQFEALDKVVVPEDFDFSTTRNVSIEIDGPDFLNGAVFSLVNYRKDQDSTVLSRGTFDDNGKYSVTYTVPRTIDTLLFVSHYVGLVGNIAIPIIETVAALDLNDFYNGLMTGTDDYEYSNTDLSSLKSVSVVDFSYMGSYNSSGVPSYLSGRDNIERNLLDDINASLPEGTKLTNSHPEYLGGVETNIRLKKDANVWVTFVAEGAGWRNALGYYTYKVGHEPSSADDIEDLKIIFPNTSLSGSGGGLRAGDKVHLGAFSAGTVVCWFIVANGWNGSSVQKGNGIHYSHSSFNAEASSSLRDHMVLLFDKSRDQLLMGFEDVPRDWSMCDNDFNDAVFYASVDPITAVVLDNVEEIDAANDSDGDGINDELDDFPYDPNKTFNNYSPSAGSVGSLAFEDLWPNKGDYDFNDLVVDYSFNQIANAQNYITSLEANIVIRHIGASFRNGFAFTIPVSSSQIESITNQSLTVGYANVNSVGVESESGGESTIFVFEDAYLVPDRTINLVVKFNTPISSNTLKGAPYNPFICVNGSRSHEVHLADMPPTSYGGSYLGEEEDYSSASSNRYYKSKRNLPWAINVYEGYNPPPEKVSIDKVYPSFVNWANSGGTEDLNWYAK